MPRARDPHFKTGHLCRFCGGLISWGTILRLIRTDPDTPGYMLLETACHTECLARVLRPGVALAFHRHWDGKAPMPEDDADIFLPLDGGGLGGGDASTGTVHDERTPPLPLPIQGRGKIRPCARCGDAIAPPELVRLRVQKPVGPVKRPEFDEQTLPFHFECLAAVSRTRFG
jgi:hypothetical protein